MDADYTLARQGAVLFDLAGRGLVEVAGRDAVAFLHNLCTNDIKGLPAGSSCEAFLTTAKARVVAHFFVSRLRGDAGDVLWLDMVPGLADAVYQQLDRYLVSEEVQLLNRSEEVGQLYLCGPRAAEALGQLVPAPPLRELEIAPADPGAGGQVRRHDFLGPAGWDLLCPRTHLEELKQLLTSAGALPGRPETFEVLRVEAGVPICGIDISADRLVMEVGRTAQAVSYTKGCYLGQEPIVMARDRGHVNRTLLGLTLPEGGPVPPGARVFCSGEEVGQVTSSVWSPRLGRAIALAYLRRGSQEPGTMVEVEAQGRRPAVVTALPFGGS